MCFPPPWSVLGIGLEQKIDSLQLGLPRQIPLLEVGNDQHHILNQTAKRQYHAHWQWFTARKVLLHLRRNLRGKKSIEKAAEHIKSQHCRDKGQLYASCTGFSPSISPCKAASFKPWFTNQVYIVVIWNRVWDWNPELCSSRAHRRTTAGHQCLHIFNLNSSPCIFYWLSHGIYTVQWELYAYYIVYPHITVTDFFVPEKCRCNQNLSCFSNFGFKVFKDYPEVNIFLLFILKLYFIIVLTSVLLLKFLGKRQSTRGSLYHCLYISL